MYFGKVISVGDKLKLGRVKVKVFDTKYKKKKIFNKKS